MSPRSVILSLSTSLLLALSGVSMELYAQAPRTDSVSRAVNDSLLVIQFAEVYISANRTVRPLTIEERRQLWRRIRDVKKVYPYAKYVAATIIETYEYMQTLPEKEQEPHLKRVEKELKEDMEPKMKDLTLNQGKLLIKLINRQCGMTGYELVQAFLGGFKAWTWQVFAPYHRCQPEGHLPSPDGSRRCTHRAYRPPLRSAHTLTTSNSP